jgi:hypothetical protein
MMVPKSGFEMMSNVEMIGGICRYILPALLLNESQMQGDQKLIGPDKLYFPFILCLDETQISPFNGVPYHPVIAQAGSMPADIRNGYGYGGGVLIGYIPKVRLILYVSNSPNLNFPKIVTLNNEKKNPSFKEFKRNVLHRTIELILACLRFASEIGKAIKCGDDIVRILVLAIYILSMDFQKQRVFHSSPLCHLFDHLNLYVILDVVITCGLHSLFPCTVCYVPKDSLAVAEKNGNYALLKSQKRLTRRPAK